MGLQRPGVRESRRRVFLHVGLPKTGTTFLQELLRLNDDLLRSHGVLYPGTRRIDQFHAAVELRKAYRDWGVSRAQVEGTWARLCAEALAFPGPSILGHEILAAARPPTLERVATDLADVELHLVVTVRDLGRQIPAWWQEWVKNGNTEDFRSAMERFVLPEWDQAQRTSWFWRTQDLLGVLRRWGAVVPAERTHVVICPPSGSRPDALWRRFCEAVGIPDGLAVEPPPRRNESLGVAEVALLRSTNEALDGRLVQPFYGPVVKHWFTQQVLSPRSSPRPGLPAEMRPRVEQLTDRWVEHLATSGVQVHGPLEDLRPRPGDRHAAPPDTVDDGDLALLAPKVSAGLLLEVARLRQELEEAHRQLDRIRRALHRGPLGLLLRARNRVRRLAHRVG